MKKEYPIKFMCQTEGHKFRAIISPEYTSKGYYGLGDTLSQVVVSLVNTLNCYTPYTWECIEKPKPHLIRD